MTTISITKEKVLELIKKDTCKFYDYDNYSDLDINVIFNSVTELKYFEDGTTLQLTSKDLSSLLFDRVVKVSDELLITVS
jgi:hypothetical protein